MLDQFENHLHARRRSPNTIRLRLVYVRQLAAVSPLMEVTPSILEDVIASHPQWKPETVNAAISSWRVFFKWAVRYGHVVVDPTEFLEPAYVPRVVKVLADDVTINAALDRAPLRDRVILRLGRELGLRRTEIATLRVVDRSGEWLRITGKGGRVRELHMQPGLLAELLELEATEATEFYFPGNQDGHIGASTVYRRVMDMIGTPTHSLRRTALTVVYRRSGNDIRMAQEFAGHANPSTTAVYLNVTPEDRVEAGRLAALAA